MDSYELQELLAALFNLVAGYVSIGSGWKFDSLQSLAINLCPYRSTIGAGSNIETPKSLSNRAFSISKTGTTIIVYSGPFLPISTKFILTSTQADHITITNISTISILPTFNIWSNTDVSKFEKINPSISVNGLVFENKEVFPSYASSMETDHITSMYWWSLTMKVNSITSSLQTCLNSSPTAPNRTVSHTCARTLCTVFHHSDYSRRICRNPSRARSYLSVTWWFGWEYQEI